MQQIIGHRKPGHVFVVGVGSEEVHPVLAVYLFGHDGAGLGPLHIPVASVRWDDDAVARPVNEVFRSGEAELRVVFVVSGVGEVEGVTNRDQPRIFDSAVAFVVCFRREHRFSVAREVNAIGALGISETRSARRVLRAIKHHVLAAKAHNRGIEHALRFPRVATGRKDRRGRDWPQLDRIRIEG